MFVAGFQPDRGVLLAHAELIISKAQLGEAAQGEASPSFRVTKNSDTVHTKHCTRPIT